MSAGFARQLRLLAGTLAVLSASGCASLTGAWNVAPNGLAGDDDRLRRMLAGSEAPAAFQRVQKSAPADEMLHALYHGILAYHAGDWAESARALDIAAHIADERMTLSLSRAALSMVTSDLAQHYTPGRTERLMIPYYAALARMRMGDVDGAAVEARRLSMLLQRFQDEGADLAPALRATLRYVAGAIFAWSGDRNDADVAFRNAVALDASLEPYRAGNGNGTVLVVLEQGFVAHRVEQGLAVMLLPEEVHAIAHGGGEDRTLASAFVAGRILDYATRGPYGGRYDDRYATRDYGTLHVPAPDRSLLPEALRRTVTCTPAATGATVTTAATTVTDTTRTTTGTVTTTTRRTERSQAVRDATAERAECTEQDREVDDLPYLLRVAWPAYRSDYRVGPVRLMAGADTVSISRVADISAGVLADFEEERAAILARTIARGTAKLALTKGAERRIEEHNEVAGRIVGLLGNVGTALLERADTRSWHLLPAGMSVLRVELPPGEHALSVEVDGRRIDLGPVQVQAGGLVVVPSRAW
ncbi:MAG TPA: hypothetical protein VK929_07325 [Longimicrobiales bacterium]|nr:hypothetical protein [Longimicrobiales bacterium]